MSDSNAPLVERLQGHLRTLAEATTELVRAEREIGPVLRDLARTVGTRVEASCVIFLLEGGFCVPAGDYYPSDRIREVVEKFQSDEPIQLDGHDALRAVVVSGEPLWVPEVESRNFKNVTTKRAVTHIEESRMRSLLVVALRAGSKSLGFMSIARYGDQPPLDEHDRDFAVTLGRHGGAAIERARAKVHLYSALQASEAHRQELAMSSEALQLLFEANPVPMIVFDVDTLALIAVNDAALELYRYSREEFLSLPVNALRAGAEAEQVRQSLATLPAAVGSGSSVHVKKDGTTFPVDYMTRGLRFEGRNARMTSIKDVTDRVRIEEQLRQAQKMEAVGRLAGGVAHDFNNALSVIFSFGELLREELAEDDPARADVGEIITAASRAAELTRQLLSFSRQQVLAPRVVNLNQTVVALGRMLGRVVGETITLDTTLDPNLGTVRIDPSGAEQCLLNLILNAKDATPAGGRISIETRNVELDGEYATTHLGSQSGPHVLLAVSDTGIGMDKATQAQIFEPFFTTKEQGKGTGLGLSLVFGFVQQSGGSIWVYSEPGLGTTFKIYLPRVDGVAKADRPTSVVDVLRGTETILLAEDEDQVRTAAERALGRRGYVVLPAKDAAEAIAIAKRHQGTIQLLLSDMVMPQASGIDLAAAIAELRPGTKVLLMSGYTRDAATLNEMFDEEGVEFLQKPFTAESLARRVREVLDG